MTNPSVSVVVVSRHRPKALMRCVTGISQLRYAPFEIIVVADSTGIEIVRESPLSAIVKTLAFDAPNIAQARNVGIEAAGGDIGAFIDDDAVPEPGWLRLLMAPFQDPNVAACGGFVRGRNGISWQRRASSVDLAGQATLLEIGEDQPVTLKASPGRAIKTEGTNMAVRRSVLLQLGGFDPNYHYFLDETDLNLRLAQRGGATAIAPRAVVHHGFAKNVARRSDRVPLNLWQIGASWAVFLTKHCSKPHSGARWAQICEAERKRLLAHMVDGRLEPRDVRKLLKTLRDGYTEGLHRTPTPMDPIESNGSAFLPVPSERERASIILSGRVWSKRRLHALAQESAQSGKIPDLYLFSPTTLYHTRRYHPHGYWVQRGGLFGKSLRSDPAFAWWRFAERVAREASLWSKFQ